MGVKMHSIVVGCNYRQMVKSFQEILEWNCLLTVVLSIPLWGKIIIN
jgi:hypothetical protein